jgi:hypothetical protein
MLCGEFIEDYSCLVLSVELGYYHVAVDCDGAVDRSGVGVDFDDIAGDGGVLFDQFFEEQQLAVGSFTEFAVHHVPPG